MNFDIATESGVYGDQDDTSEQYFRVNAEARDFSMVFEKAIDSTYDVTVRRPADIDADEFLENISQDPEIYSNSELYVVPDFPVGDQNFEETTMMMYRTRPLSEREDDAIVEVSLGEQMGEERIRWVNRAKEDGVNNYSSEMWYMGTDLRQRPVIDHLSQGPVSEKELQQLVEEAEFLIENHNFHRM